MRGNGSTSRGLYRCELSEHAWLGVVESARSVSGWEISPIMAVFYAVVAHARREIARINGRNTCSKLRGNIRITTSLWCSFTKCYPCSSASSISFSLTLIKRLPSSSNSWTCSSFLFSKLAKASSSDPSTASKLLKFISFDFLLNTNLSLALSVPTQGFFSNFPLEGI